MKTKMLMLAYKQESGFQGQQEVSGLFALMGVSIKSLRLRRELSPDVSFSKEVMYSASYSIIRGGTFISLPPKRKRDVLFSKRTAADKDPFMQQFLPLLSPTFKCTAEVPKLVSVWSKVTGGSQRA